MATARRNTENKPNRNWLAEQTWLSWTLRFPTPDDNNTMSLFRTTSIMRSLQRPATRAFSRYEKQNGLLSAVLRNNAGYVTAIVGAAVVAEFAFGKVTYAMFSGLNRGVR